MKCAYKIHWTESEAGWGQRPDGTTVHIDKATAYQYIIDYWEREKKRNTNGAVPYEYTRPDEPVLCEVPNDIYEKLQTEKSFWWHTSRWM